MGEAGPGAGLAAGLGPREAQEPEEDEAAAPGAPRGCRAGSRGGIRVLKRNAKRTGSRSCQSRSRVGSRERTWLKGDVGRGCVYVYGGDSAAAAPSDLRLVLCTVDTQASEICDREGRKNLFLQLHGDLVRGPVCEVRAAMYLLEIPESFYFLRSVLVTPKEAWMTRRLEPTEKPLQIVYDYLAQLGFDDPFRMQEEAANSDLSCMIRFYSEKPCQVEQLDRILLSGVYNVRKGKTQLHKWAERSVSLCGTCLIVSSVKDSHAGKMHILPLVGGKVEEMKRRQYTLAFTSAGAQAQTYHVSFDTLAECQRWHRQASTIVSMRFSMVDLSCYSLEEVPEHLFYSQDITYLNLRHNFMRTSGAGSLDSLCRFSQLKSLNLSHNRLGEFPESLCEISTLTELNISCNGLHYLPSQIGKLLNLQTFWLDGNFLTSLPEEMGNLQQLNCLGLSFNNFCELPAICEKLVTLDKLALAGNLIETLDLTVLNRMGHIKSVDLRLNNLKRAAADTLEGNKSVAYMDLRDNQMTDLDLSSLVSLEQLHCERNKLRELTLSGFSLRALYANSNCLTAVNIYPVPGLLTCLELSRNQLQCVPDWACEAKKLEVLDVSYNLLLELPSRILRSLSLRKLMVGHNHLQSLPPLQEHIPLEVLDLQHNLLTKLPETLFVKALNLRYLNASANSLESLPSTCPGEESLSMLQLLYLTNNNLTDQCIPVLVGHPNLRILHLANNNLQTFPASKLSKLEHLEELNLSGNKLKTIPTTVANCKLLHTLNAHSNEISIFPEILHLPRIQALPGTLQELDLSGNTNLVLEHKTLDIFSHITTLKIDAKPSLTADSALTSVFWSHGVAEMAGQRNKLCVSSLALGSFAEGVEAVYGMFDGDKNEELPRLLQCTMADVLLEEVQQSDTMFMSNTFLVSHRKLGTAGQKLGSSAVLCYIRNEVADPASNFSLTVANVGTCQAVLCRSGKALPLSKVFSLEQCSEEARRIKEQKAIITEDNKVNGVTCCTRMLGCTYLHPWILPKPHVNSIPLTVQDELLLLGNKALWEHLSYAEAVSAVRHLHDPLAAAKKLCTLAQSYGCQDNVGAMVVCLNISEDNCTCEMHGLTLTGPGGFSSTTTKPATPSCSSGIASEFSSELSASEVSSEVGSTASDEHSAVGLDGSLLPRQERRCSLHPVPPSSIFQRQPSSATFSSNQSDNGLDSDDEQPVEGVMTNGSKVEVEVDIHCCKGKGLELEHPAAEYSSSAPGPEDDSGLVLIIRRQNSVNSNTVQRGVKEKCELQKSLSTCCLYGKKLSNGSIVPLEESLNLIEVATEAPKKKTGYFAAPSQMEPEDQFVVPPDLEEEVKEQMKQHQEDRADQELKEEHAASLPEEFDTAL
ncbi:PH domain leucine-rich repeat-containing protein phosphatase 2 isoform X2 [Haemorhous mexicanus]|uniref:PH domain leucine-rich repeat-containing protein phosphatase 2 isoform X2 n=1 Tax=Haemorhous mexicanus TaxID=30427 RepID=UPI0028BE3BF5|nr:PH domain leucine-rich repeat-containing protein phosphatase 2 isoform X2 [Haemorhous mexicanus]